MEKICKECGYKLSNREIINNECNYCKQKRITSGTLFFGIALTAFFITVGIIRGALASYDYDGFNTEIMFASWSIGFWCILVYYLIYSLFRKIDLIIASIKEK